MANIEFFTEEDITQLNKFAGQSKTAGDVEKQLAYEYLKKPYFKVEYWARSVQEQLFPNGHIHVVKKPTNQANIFEYYQWAKIYPDDATWNLGKLAFTVGFDTKLEFSVKIDTVGLSDKDPQRLQYTKSRGEFDNSPLVKIYSSAEILSKNWNDLIKMTISDINELKPAYDELLSTVFDIASKHIVEEKSEFNFALNTILYGPPGTGKTYNTIKRAVQIANPKFSFLEKEGREVGRKEIKKEFVRLIQEEQISFSSFHQSLNYEDFIEGIKPQKPNPNGSLTYDIEDGIFKDISNRALSDFNHSLLTNPENAAFEDAFEQLKDDWELNQDMKFPLKTQGYDFKILGFTNTSIRFEKASGGTDHTLSINILRDLYYGEKYDFKQGVGIYYPSILSKLKTYKSTSNKIEKKGEFKNFVLIIDEINRGNVSQIFGELITLIEDDKRTGMAEELSAILPYSKQSFSVPKNLFIIGTMNTADRSVEALDTALRRRFSFEFMPPIDKHVTEEVEGIPLRLIFNQINDRIGFLLDNDHQIGHAYFMNIKEIEDLRDVFNNKIIPLLKEYFYNDFKKIYLVLGNGFVEKKNYKPTFAAADNDELARELYTIKVIDDSFNIKEAMIGILGK